MVDCSKRCSNIPHPRNSLHQALMCDSRQVLSNKNYLAFFPREGDGIFSSVLDRVFGVVPEVPLGSIGEASYLFVGT